MANFTGTSANETLGVGGLWTNTSASETARGGGGADRLIYDVSAAGTGGNDLYYGGTGVDVLELRFSNTDWTNNAGWRAQALQLQMLVANTPTQGNGQVNLGTTWLPRLTFTPGSKTLQAYEVESVEIWVGGVLFTGNLPVSITSGAQSGSVTEDAVIITTGTIAFNDNDVAQAHTASAAGPASIYGSFALSTVTESPATAPGTVAWSYTLNNAATAVQNLAAGQTVVETYVVTINDGNGSTASQAVSVTITGAADVANTTVGSVKESGVTPAPAYAPEPGVPVAQGQIVDANIPSNAVWTVVGTPDTTYGGLTISSSGLWTYTLVNIDPDTQALDEGQIVVLQYDVAATYGSPSQTVFRTVDITITGTNDVPVMTVVGIPDNDIIEAGGVLNASNPDGAAGGVLTVVDPDGTPFTGASVGGTYGTLAIAPNGVWNYTLNNGALNVQALAGGQSVTDTLTLTVDGSSHVFTINITGQDDKPTITIADTVNPDPVSPPSPATLNYTLYDDLIKEAGGVQNGTNSNASAGGQFLLQDFDTSPVPPMMALSSAIDPFTGFRVDNTGSRGMYGDFTLNTSTGVWSYTLRNGDLNVQALDDGDLVSETLVVKDSSGQVSATVTVTIDGTDDLVWTIQEQAPPADTVVAEQKDATLLPVAPAVVPDQFASGDLEAIDLDDVAAVTFQVTGSSATPPSNYAVPGGADLFLKGTYGDFALNSTSGQWYYDLRSTDQLESLDTNNAVDGADAGVVTTDDIDYQDAESLHEGEIRNEVMVVTSSDGGASYAVTVQVRGYADAAQFFDVTPVVPAQPMALVSDIANRDGDYQIMEAGGLLNTSNPNPTASGFVASLDRDRDESGWTATSAGSLAGEFGDFTFNFVTGGWTYVLRNGATNVQELKAGDIETDTLTLTSIDGTVHSLVVTITGANDTAIITNNGGDLSAKEAGGVNNLIAGDLGAVLAGVNANGDLDVVDVDGTGGGTEARFATAFTVPAEVGAVGAATGRHYGTFTLVNPYTGAWTYTINEFDLDTLDLNDGESATDSVLLYSADGSASTTVTVTVIGQSDVVTLQMAAGADVDVQADGTVSQVPGPGVDAFDTAGPVTSTAVAPGVLTTGAALVQAGGRVVTAFGPTPNPFTTPSGSYAGVYGTFTFVSNGSTAPGGNGTWTYILDNEDLDTRALTGGQVVQDSLSVQSFSGEVFQINVNVRGADTATNFPNEVNNTDILPNGTMTYTVRDGDPFAGALVLRVDDVVGPTPNLLVGTAIVNDGTLSSYANPLVPPGGPVVMGPLEVYDGNPAHVPVSLNAWIGQGTDNPETMDASGAGAVLGGLFAGYGGDDTIITTTGDDYVDGGTGDDFVQSSDGFDTVLGGIGEDTVFGGNGEDHLMGGANNDDLNGDADDDSVEGGAGNDVLAGSGGADTLDGGTEDDIMDGGDDNDLMMGGDGADNMLGGGTDAGADEMLGGAGADTMDGGDGADELNGGTGVDSLTGGLGADLFVFDAFGAANADVVTDYTDLDDSIGVAKALLGAIYAGFNQTQLTTTNTQWYADVAGINPADYGAGPVNNPNVRFVYDTTTGVLYYDADGANGAAPQQAATFTGAPVLGFDEFVFS